MSEKEINTLFFGLLAFGAFVFWGLHAVADAINNLAKAVREEKAKK